MPFISFHFSKISCTVSFLGSQRRFETLVKTSCPNPLANRHKWNCYNVVACRCVLLGVAAQSLTGQTSEPTFSPPRKLPLGIPIKIAIIEKIESAQGTMGRGKSPPPRPRFLFLSPQPPYNTKRPLPRRRGANNSQHFFFDL